jgi:hypothetical protein
MKTSFPHFKSHATGLLFAGLTCLVAVPGFSQVLSAISTDQHKSISRDGMEVQLGGPGVIQVRIDGATLSSESRIYCISPDWTRRFYGFEDDKDLLTSAKVEAEADGTQRLTLHLNGQGSGFTGTLTYELASSRTLHIRLRASIPNTTASIENRILTLPTSWLVGRPVAVSPPEAAGAGLTMVHSKPEQTTGIAPLVAASEEISGATIAQKFQTLLLDTRLGPVTMTTSGTLPISLVDYRRNKWAQGALYYWFGVLDNRLQSDSTGEYDLTIAFPEARKDPVLMSAAIQSVQPQQKVLAPATHPDRILPTPKSLQWLDGEMVLTSKTQLGTLQSTTSKSNELADDDLHQRLQSLRQALNEATSLDLSQTPWQGTPDIDPQQYPEPAILLHLTQLPELPQVASDRYRIRFVKPETVVLEAPTTQGLRSAQATLLQLVRPGPTIRRAQVDDGASLPFRGIHFFTGRNSGELQKRFVTEILGPLKINHLLWQVDYLQWESFPQIHHPRYGMDKAEAALVRDAARALGLSIIPLVNTFGHSEWLLNNDQFRHLADNPDNPYAYDPSNPETVPTVEKIYEEALAFFQPTDFHIGHDEITNEDFPRREANRAIGARQLIKDSIRHWHGYLAARGVRTHLWGDMFLHASEANDAGFADSVEDAKALRAALPPGVVIHDWHYGPDPVEAFISLKVLNDDGLDTIAATWSDGRNVGRFAKQATMQHWRQDRPTTAGRTLGHLQTTWAGYSFDQHSLENHPDQYAAYVLAAEASWNGGFIDPAELPYDYRAEFARLWNADLLDETAAPGWTVNLNAAANFDAIPPPGSPTWMGAFGADGLVGLSSGQVRFGRWLFHIPGKDQLPRAVHFTSLFEDGPGTSRLSLPVRRRVKALKFALAATHPGPQNEQIAHTIVHYGDGTSTTIPWRLGLNAFALEDDRETFQAPVLWRKALNTPNDPPRVIHGYLWMNPHPQKPIRTIETLSDKKASGLLLFGVSGLDVAPAPSESRRRPRS